MENEKLFVAVAISEYLHTLEGLQPLVWHQARGVSERIAEIAIAHLTTGSTLTAAPGQSGVKEDDLAQPQVNPTVRPAWSKKEYACYITY